jgi:hypothetical protein
MRSRIHPYNVLWSLILIQRDDNESSRNHVAEDAKIWKVLDEND